MSRVVTETTVARADLDAVMVPRDGVVLERASGQGRFELAEGPFADYRRTVVAETLPDGRVHVTQTVEFRLDIPYWGFIFVLPFKGVLGRLGPVPARTWWSPPDRFDARAAHVFGLLAAASVMVGFLASLMTQTATFAVDEFAESNAAQGTALAVTRAAALFALPLVALADRRGRRRIVIVTAIAGPIVAATGALAPSLVWLTVSQTLTRSLALAMGITIAILLAEEMPANSRAYGVSLVSMAGAFGVGLILFALPLADVDERGWRAVYALALLGLPLAWDLRRRLPESRRFGAPHQDVPVRSHGARFRLLAVSGLLLAVFGAPASQFHNEFLRDELGFSGGRISLFTIATNTPGVIGIVIGGRLADTRGRRPVAAVGLAVGTLATVAQFNSAGWPVWVWSLAGAIVGAAVVPALGVYGPELFPTSLRGRLTGVITVISLVGSVLGLVAVGVLSERFDQLGPALALMAIGPLALAALVLLAYPETAHHTLEELNPEDLPPPSLAPGAADLG